jgi:Tfp pilus assembly protein PilF
MKLLQALFIKLQITVASVSLIMLGIQPSQAVEILPEQVKPQENLQAAAIHNNRGVELAEQGKFAEAIAAFHQAIEIYPQYENAHNNLGLAFGNQQQYAQAENAFKHALAINPRNFEIYNNLGIALGSQGKFAEAIAAFRRAIQLEPNDPTSYQNLGVAFWSQGNLLEARASLHKAKDIYATQNNPAGISHIEQILQQMER